jgi:hypothetical protein
MVGSGPNSWYHDYNSATGIADMKGNVSEQNGGLRMVDGEIQVIPYGNAMNDIHTGESDIQGPASAIWQALLADGTFVDPGTADTLKWDYTSAPAKDSESIQLIAGNLQYKQSAIASANGMKEFKSLTAKSGLTIGQRMKALALFPAYGQEEGFFGFRNFGEIITYRGGNYIPASHGGVFSVFFENVRGLKAVNVGFRSAYYE